MLIVPAYAKLNLALDVVGRRSDGWHDIESVIVALDWHDLVGLALPPVRVRGTCRTTVPMVRLSIDGPAAVGVPFDETNLAVRALRQAGDGLPGGLTAARLWVHKRIPSQAGLGGGSADAAAVLRAVAMLDAAADPLGRGGRIRHIGHVGRIRHIGHVGWSPGELAAVAAALGSDIPAILAGGNQFVSGRGDRLRRLADRELHIAVAIAGRSATVKTYAALDGGEYRSSGRAGELAECLDRGLPIRPELFGSALEEAAVRAEPSLGLALDTIRTAVPEVAWHMTGSGGGVFAVGGNAAATALTAAAARRAGFPARACRTLAAA